MADVKISGLPASTTPLAGTEVLPIVQGTTTKKVSVANLTAGRNTAFNSFSATTNSAIGVTSRNWLSGYTALDFNGGSIQAGTTNLFSVYQNSFRDTNGNFPYASNGAAQRFDYDSGSIYWYTAPSGVAGNLATFTNRVILYNTTGNVNLLTGNLIVSNGKGIDFSATPGTGTSELLADYEEGTWVPTLTTSGTDFGSVTYSAVTGGRYIKVGNVVHIQGVIRTDAVTIGSASGSVRIGGLPFTVAANTGSTANGNAGLSIGLCSAWQVNNPINLMAIAGTATMTPYTRATSLSETLDVPASTGVATGASANSIRFAGTYVTS